MSLNEYIFGRFNKKNLHSEYLCEQEYFEKKYNKDNTIVLIRVGSFYEAYGTETRGYNLNKLAEILNAKLARKNSKNNEPIGEKNPYMVGFPAVSKQKHIKILLEHNFTIVIIDQVTAPPNPTRKVTEILSSSTCIEEQRSSGSNNLISLYIEDEKQTNGTILLAIGMSMIDLTTGKSQFYEVYSKNTDTKYALDETVRFINSNNPNEIIITRIEEENTLMKKDKLLAYLEIDNKVYYYKDSINKEYTKINYQDKFFETIFKDRNMSSGIEYVNMEYTQYARLSYINLLHFAKEHNRSITDGLLKPKMFDNNNHLVLGNNAIYQLNVLESNIEQIQNQKVKFRSLYDVINFTSTSMGKRFLKENLVAPLISKTKIQTRYNQIEQLLNNDLYETIEIFLNEITDIERKVRKITLNILNPQEFESLYQSFKNVKNIIKYIKKDQILKSLISSKFKKDLDKFITNCEYYFNFDIMKLYNLNDIENSFINKTIDNDIDQIQNDIEDNMNFLNNISKKLSLCIDKKENNLTLNRNDRDGYYLTITTKRATILKNKLKKIKNVSITDNISICPENLEYKQKLKTGFNITCTKLKNFSEETIEKRSELKEKVKNKYQEIMTDINKTFANLFIDTINFVSEIDILKSACKMSKKYNYTKPIIKDSHKSFIKCENLRHPIVERIVEDKDYIPVDIKLGVDDHDGILLHGLNSSGKSTNMKAVGLSIVLAQCGFYVPASKFEYCPYHSLFARITSNDNLFKGLSSFVLEMTELYAILKRVGKNTLVIGDEICRGTEQTSGNSIVSAAIITLSKSESSFIFATHLHQIAKLKSIKELKNVKPYHLTVQYDEQKDLLIFDRKLKEGQGPDIYGLTVMKYIIQDNEFIKLANKMQDEVTNTNSLIINENKSKYNSKIYLTGCEICKRSISNDEHIDTHHIEYQKDCKDGFCKNKPHIKKNNESNLITLCKKCHTDVHCGNLIIEQYQDTSKGRQIKYSYKEDSKDQNKKYSDEQCEMIINLKDKLSKTETKALLKNKYKINISKTIIKKIWDGLY